MENVLNTHKPDGPCEVCRNDSTNVVWTGYGFDDSVETYDLVCCDRCGIVATRPIVSPSELAVFYDSSYYGGKHDDVNSDKKFHPILEGLVRFANASRGKEALHYLDRNEAIATTLPKSRRILDVGCGRGVFLKSMAKAGHECVGIEIAKFNVDTQENLTILQGTIEDLRLPSDSFDAVWIWHVLEHTLTPSTTIGEISRVTRPGGVVAVAVPNFGSWQSWTFGRHWFHLDLPRHRFHFTRQSLVRLLREHQLEPFSVHTLSWEQNVFGWIQSLLNVFFYRKHPNGLYRILKHDPRNPVRGEPTSRFQAFVWLLLAVALLIPAVIHTILASMLGKGATLIVHAVKLKE